jgi:hypothetical protein
MKPRTLFFIGCIAGGIVGLIPGYLIGNSLRDTEERNRSHDDLKASIRQREFLQILDFVEGKVHVESKDEGGLFKAKIIHYPVDDITNNSIATTAKDIKVKVDFISGTNSIISSEEVIAYSAIQPYHTQSFKERIFPPERREGYKYSLVDAKVE